MQDKYIKIPLIENQKTDQLHDANC